MKLLQSMKEALQIILFFLAFITFMAVLFTGIGMLANDDPLVGLLILLPVLFVGLTTIIYVDKRDSY